MKWFWSSCGRYRERISLLAAGALAAEERVAVENHLAACADCQKFHRELSHLTVPLARWEKHFSDLEPGQGTRTRWAAAIQRAPEPEQLRRFSPKTAFQVLWQELVWPCRRTWAGLAAVWVGLLAFHLAQSGRGQTITAQSSSPPAAEIRFAWQEQQRILIELIGSTPLDLSAEPTRRSDPQPHSEERAIRMG